MFSESDLLDFGVIYPKQFSPTELKPIPLKTQTFTPSRPIQPQNFVFLGRTAPFLVQDPLSDPLPSLPASLSLCLYLGAVRAPLLKLLLKREHIQWGLSQSHSVSIKDPGNTTLPREPLLKGQWDPGLRNLSPSTSHLFHGKRKNRNLCSKSIIHEWYVNSAGPSPRQRVPASP